MGMNTVMSHLIILLANTGLLPTVPKLEFCAK